MLWGETIADISDITGQSGHGLLSLVFANGNRPDSDSLITLAASGGERAASGGAAGVGFAVSHRPATDEGWLELLAMGLAFDCRGLVPAAPAPLPAAGQQFGLNQKVLGEAISLAPGPHLEGGENLLPVIRVLCGLGATLAQLAGVQAVCWEPAKSWMEPQYFIRTITDWLGGGAFPALGLTSLERESNGTFVSHGLDFLIGQELRFEPDRDLPPAAAARIAVRLIHQLVEGGAITSACDLVCPDGKNLSAVPVRDGRQLRVIRRP